MNNNDRKTKAKLSLRFQSLSLERIGQKLRPIRSRPKKLLTRSARVVTRSVDFEDVSVDVDEDEVNNDEAENEVGYKEMIEEEVQESKSVDFTEEQRLLVRETWATVENHIVQVNKMNRRKFSTDYIRILFPFLTFKGIEDKVNGLFYDHCTLNGDFKPHCTYSVSQS